jgi:tRNA pseudouridine55 synthase
MRHGFLLIDKPTGITSHDVVYRVRKTLHEKDIGHLGTLDPNASGLMVLAIGSKALKLIEYFGGLTKEYVADVRFGSVSSTFDAEGQMEPVKMKPGVPLPTIESVRRVIIDNFTGAIDQVPPMHSAVHIAGQRAYELARQGKMVEMPSRKVEIAACEILSFAYPNLKLRVGCSSGTYIRSLANDLGTLLRCGGYLHALRRSKVGEWSIEKAASMDTVQWTDVMPLKEILKSFPSIALTDEEATKIRMGQRIPRKVADRTIGWHQDLPIVVLFPYRLDAALAQPKKVL